MLRSRAADERTVEMEAKQRSPGVPIKRTVVSTTNPGLERHPGDIPDEDPQHQQGVFAAATGLHTGRQVHFAARTKTKNTYFHRVAQHGQAVDGRRKTVVRPIKRNQMLDKKPLTSAPPTHLAPNKPAVFSDCTYSLLEISHLSLKTSI